LAAHRDEARAHAKPGPNRGSTWGNATAECKVLRRAQTEAETSCRRLGPSPAPARNLAVYLRFLARSTLCQIACHFRAARARAGCLHATPPKSCSAAANGGCTRREEVPPIPRRGRDGSKRGRWLLRGRRVDRRAEGLAVIAPGGTAHDFENRTRRAAGALNFSVPGELRAAHGGESPSGSARAPPPRPARRTPPRSQSVSPGSRPARRRGRG